MANNFITWNGISSETLGLHVETYPNLNRPARKYTAADVPGRNGSAYILEDAWSEYVQAYEISAKSPVANFKAIAEWLNSADGYAVLKDSYDPDIYRMAVVVDSFDVKNSLNRAGKALIQFRCRPERYLISEDIERTAPSSDPIVNDSNHTSHPLIKVVGLGAQSLLRLTDRTEHRETYSSPGKSVKGLQSQTALTYYTGLGTVTQLENNIPTTFVDQQPSKISGVSITRDAVDFSSSSSFYGIGFNVPAQGNLTYTISYDYPATATVNGGIDIICCSANGLALAFYNQAGANPGTSKTATFTTPSGTAWIVLLMRSRVGSGRMVYSNIQLCTGTEAQTYVPNQDDTSASFTFGDCIISMSELGDYMFIDCETMNIYGSGGENLNSVVTITDLFGNQTPKFPRLEVGENAIELSGNDWIKKIPSL